jgi:DNA primase
MNGTYYCWNAGCPANGKGLSGLQFLSLLTKRSYSEIKRELLQRAGTFSAALKTNNTVENKNNSLNDLFNELHDKKEKKETLINQKLLDNKWIELPDWVKTEVNKRKIFKSPYISRDWNLYYDKITDRLVIPWTDDYYQLRALTKQQEEESGKYMFPPEIEKPIFGLNNIDTSFKYLFLLEGVFDAIFVKNGLAVRIIKTF